MRKAKKYLALFLYYGIFSKLPNYAFPGGKLFNGLRIFCLKGVLKIGKNCRIMRKVYVGNGNEIRIGSFSRINENVRLDNVEIGDYVMIARETIILGKMHGYDDIDVPMESQKLKSYKPTVIEDNVWIGTRVIVMPGKKISKGCIIGAGAVVTKDTDENGIYAGVPAKLIKFRK